MFNDLILDKMKKVFEYIATLLLLTGSRDKL